MKFFKYKFFPNKSINIAMRTTLFSWVVALSTLFLFIIMTIPQEKSIYFKNLESKANSVAVSLHNAAAGAAVNEDYASVVTTGQTMLAGDPELDFLIVMKNDGFAMILEQTSWKVENINEPYWLPKKRDSISVIVKVPTIDRRVFHFAQPFDYSGMEWGWIHVGLSLKNYDNNVNSLYRNIIILILGCALFSLLGSIIYAKRLVKPIIHLQSVVQNVASGDLSSHAVINRNDELGSLAKSVNAMTKALLHRDMILESVRFAAQQFMRASQWEEAINPILSKMGEAAEVSRAYIFENQTDIHGKLFMSQRYEWVSHGIKPLIHNSKSKRYPYLAVGFEHWVTLLGNNEILSEIVSEMSEAERAIFEPQEIRSIVAIPVFVDDTWWGFLGFGDCVNDRIWTDAEKDSLRAGADMLGATIARQKVQAALVESKIMLEHRVNERTVELQNQVAAKEQAYAELTALQGSLMEMSRSAGMAEVATGVIHNVGNVLNSVNVSCTLLMDQIMQSRVGNISKIADMLANPEGGIAYFLTEDPRGKQIPIYLTSLASALKEEHQIIKTEAESLRSRIEHIKEIVAMQQSYGRVSGFKETIPPEQLMEDALKLIIGAIEKHGITVQRQYEAVSPISVDKHKVLQILLNLINNAKHACIQATDREQNIMLKIFSSGNGYLKMQVKDNGIGILPENMTRIFQHGFTTRKDGHGFGLHSGALTARELGGSLSVHSDGVNLGATFTLELPIDTRL